MPATNETAEYAYAQKLEAAGNLSVTLYPMDTDCDDEQTVIVDTINGIDSEMFSQAFLDAVELIVMQRVECHGDVD